MDLNSIKVPTLALYLSFFPISTFIRLHQSSNVHQSKPRGCSDGRSDHMVCLFVNVPANDGLELVPGVSVQPGLRRPATLRPAQHQEQDEGRRHSERQRVLVPAAAGEVAARSSSDQLDQISSGWISLDHLRSGQQREKKTTFCSFHLSFFNIKNLYIFLLVSSNDLFLASGLFMYIVFYRAFFMCFFVSFKLSV